MPRHAETRFLPYTPAQLYDLVIDIERYPEFLPWCVAARILEKNDNMLKADLIAGYKAFREKFTSVVTMMPHRTIDVAYVSGPLTHLSNSWNFTAVLGGCKLNFQLEFNFKTTLFSNVLEIFFEKALKRMTDAFEARANALYVPLSSQPT